MENHPLTMLLVEDNPLDAHLVHAALATADEPFEIEHAGLLRDAIVSIRQRSFDIILLDLSLPDARGLEALQLVRSHAPTMPVVVLTGRNDRSVAMQAVREGAQDYLTKERMEADVLLRAVRYAIERQRLVVAIRDLSLKDELTGLHNRRGFFTLAEQQLKIAVRARHPLALFYADVDGLKQINDQFGHRAGDRAITEAANTLRESFRATDVQARIGGDEFVVLAVQVDAARATMLSRRIHERVATCNSAAGREYRLSLSTGVILNDSASPRSLDELLSGADAAMYARKRARQAARDESPSEPRTAVLR